ncbi:MAG: amidase [Gammaproteobacteria bacterium]|nr:amidase [Gammaproteobacteria bacterium]MYB38372.1 amidase [Gammaproteobacteria bacterium]
MTASSPAESGDAVDMASGFASGRMHPRTVLEALLARIEQIEPLVGACNDLAPATPLLAAADAAAARWRAATPHSPLDGVPFGVKANIAVAGLPWHAGVAAFRNRVASRDAVCVARLRAAGLIPVATLNMHEAALGVTSDNPAFGTTSNPWALEHIPGGSSGGSAAAVASGMLPLALGTDDLGSVRLPSALCGVVGFKPAHGAIPTEGVVPLSPSLDHVGIHARSVRDVVAVLPILSGQANRSSPSGRRPALTRWMLGASVTMDPPVAEAVCAAMSAVDPNAAAVDWSDVDLGSLRRAGLLMCECDAAHHFGAALRRQPDGFSAEFRHLVSWGASQDPARVGAAKEYLVRMRRSLRDDLRDRLLLGATTPHTAPRRAAPVQASLADFTTPPAVAGVPAISLPAPRRDDGLPVGIQVTGAYAGDVLAAAAGLFPEVAPVAHPSATGKSPVLRSTV